jgi:hypothetical protein
MLVESRTDSTLVFAPWERSKRVRSLIGGVGVLLIGIGFPIVFGFLTFVSPSGQSLGGRWVVLVAVGVAFTWAGLNHVFHALPLRLEIRRHPVGSCLIWRSWRFRITQCPQPDSVLIGVCRGQRRARHFALQFRSGNTRRQFFRSFDYWQGDHEALEQAEPMARNIGEFLNCPVEFEK